MKEIEDKDRELARLTRKLYGADISKLPPFDVAIDTDRVSPDSRPKNGISIRVAPRRG